MSINKLPDQMNHFDIHWDKVSLYTHYGIMILLASVAGLLIFIMIKNVNYFYIYLFFLLFSLVLPSIFFYTYAPRKYLVSETNLVIKKVKGEYVFPITNIAEVIRLDSKSLNKTIRTMASGGYFGYYGSFKNKQLGDFKLYGASLKENLVLIVMKDGKKLVITPKNPEHLIAKLIQ